MNSHLDHGYQKCKRLSAARDGFHNHVLISPEDLEA